MPSQYEDDLYYMQVARLTAQRSKALRKQVGACLVTPSGIIIPGYNGTAPGDTNFCELETPEGLVTKPDVIHAELNCILKAAKEGVSVKGSTIYVTLSPCLACSAMLTAAQIERVVWYENYKCTQGLDKLATLGVKLSQFTDT